MRGARNFTYLCWVLPKFTEGKHAGSLEALRVTRPEAVDLEGNNQIVQVRQLVSSHYQGLAGSYRALRCADNAVVAAQELQAIFSGWGPDV
jgi:hypothetical protein